MTVGQVRASRETCLSSGWLLSIQQYSCRPSTCPRAHRGMQGLCHRKPARQVSAASATGKKWMICAPSGTLSCRPAGSTEDRIGRILADCTGAPEVSYVLCHREGVHDLRSMQHAELQSSGLQCMHDNAVCAGRAPGVPAFLVEVCTAVAVSLLARAESESSLQQVFSETADGHASGSSECITTR